MYRLIALCSLIGIAFVVPVYAEVLASLAVAGISTLIGSGISAWSTWKGMQKQIAENRRAEALGIEIQEEGVARSEKLTKKQMAATEKWRKKEFELAEKGFEASEEQRGISNLLGLGNRMWNMMAAKPQMAQNLANIWRQRRAA